MSLQFFVVYEAEADFTTATELADRVLLEAIGWLDAESLDFHRRWHGAWHGEQLTWRRMKRLARDAGIEDRGFFEGQPGFPDAVAARRAIAFLRATVDDVSAIVLVRDQDDQPERRGGLEQARAEHEASAPRPVVVIGLAVVEREAWVIAGFEPRDEIEVDRLDGERQRLGFQPHERSHELTACKKYSAPRSPKRVLCALTGGDRPRESSCWRDTSRDLLR